MAEKRRGIAKARRAGLPLADGRAADRAAEGDTKSEEKVHVLMGKQDKMLYISPLLWYNLCYKGGEIYVRTRDTGTFE